MRRSEYTISPSNQDETAFNTTTNENDEDYGEEFETLHKHNARKS